MTVSPAEAGRPMCRQPMRLRPIRLPCCGCGGGEIGPETLPQRQNRRHAAAGQLTGTHQRVHQLRIEGGLGDLILPELDITAGQIFQIGRLVHDRRLYKRPAPLQIHLMPRGHFRQRFRGAEHLSSAMLGTAFVPC
jgi:hypothetical protein